MPKLIVYICLVVLATKTSTCRSEVKAGERELIEKVEKSLLKMFGFDSRPKFDKSKVKVHPYMYHLYSQKQKNNLDEREDERQMKSSKPTTRSSPFESANTVRSFVHTETSEDPEFPEHKTFFLFNVSSVPKSDLLRGAELRVFHVRHPSLSNAPSDPQVNQTRRRKWLRTEGPYLYRVNVYDVVRPPRGSLDPIHRLLDTHVVDARANGTISLDVSSCLVRWLRKPHLNHGLSIEVLPIKASSRPSVGDSSHVVVKRDATTMTESEWTDKQPLLVVHTDDPSIKSREKRSHPLPSDKKKLCQRYSLYVDFREVDWTDWIFAPGGYDAFFCRGTCPYPLAKHMNATNHAVIQNIIHSRYPSRVPSACCVPVRHSAISMLYYDSNKNIVLKTYQDMVVESCGCQ